MKRKREKFVPTREYMMFLSRLRLARMKFRCSQRELARRLGIHHSRIVRSENAERPLTIIEVRAVCQALQISVVDFTRELEAALNASENSTDTSSTAAPWNQTPPEEE